MIGAFRLNTTSGRIRDNKNLGKRKPPCYDSDGLATASQESNMEVLNNIIFALKERRKVIYKTLRKDIGEIFRKLCSEMMR